MKRMFFSSDLIVKTDRYYPANELLEIMKENFESKYGPFEIKKILGQESICSQGEKNYLIQVHSTGYGTAFGGKTGRLYIGQYKTFKQELKDSIPLVVVCIVTLGIGFIIWRICDFIATIFGIEGTRANRATMRAMGKELEKLLDK